MGLIDKIDVVWDKLINSILNPVLSKRDCGRNFNEGACPIPNGIL